MVKFQPHALSQCIITQYIIYQEPTSFPGSTFWLVSTQQSVIREAAVSCRGQSDGNAAAAGGAPPILVPVFSF